ncbi:hypothetical protein [Azospirillum sp. SYSU D00513]|uniref:hypothetical protein n=1 Tax=Azospirillum sp. SYSU D00513 TaxID=2812561 RepID=UPI001A972082|nr:hypothetical protein [Azospirillum sp. SYSU D00513]
MLETIAAVQTKGFWIGAFALLAVLPHAVAWTPTLADDKALGFVTKLVNLLAGNYRAAANAHAKVDAVTRMAGG